MGGLSVGHWVIVAIVLLLLFGRGKFSAAAGDLAKGIKGFKKEMRDEEAPAAPQQIPASQIPAAEKEPSAL